MAKDDGGAAFPHPHTKNDNPGMTLRDWFAGCALQGLIANPSCTEDAEKEPGWAYDLADLMLEARSR